MLNETLNISLQDIDLKKLEFLSGLLVGDYKHASAYKYDPDDFPFILFTFLVDSESYEILCLYSNFNWLKSAQTIHKLAYLSQITNSSLHKHLSSYLHTSIRPRYNANLINYEAMVPSELRYGYIHFRLIKMHLYKKFYILDKDITPYSKFPRYVIYLAKNSRIYFDREIYYDDDKLQRLVPRRASSLEKELVILSGEWHWVYSMYKYNNTLNNSEFSHNTELIEAILIEAIQRINHIELCLCMDYPQIFCLAVNSLDYIIQEFLLKLPEYKISHFNGRVYERKKIMVYVCYYLNKLLWDIETEKIPTTETDKKLIINTLQFINYHTFVNTES